MKINLKRTTILLNEEKHKQIKLAAVELGVSISKFIDDAVAHYIDYLKNKKNVN